MPDEQALLIAIPLRHLEAALETASDTVVLPAGGPGDLDAAASGAVVLVMPTDTGDAEISAATWRATFVRRVPHESGTPWPDGLPVSWTEEHPAPGPAPVRAAAEPVDRDDLDEEEDEDEDDSDNEERGLQSFLEVVDLGPLPRQEWLFANELVGKQARGGRFFRPRFPTLVDLPE